jgi:hypothetical protein
MLVQDVQVQLVRPPVTIGSAAACHLPAGPARHRTPLLIAHKATSRGFTSSALPLFRRSARRSGIDNDSLWKMILHSKKYSAE